MGKAEGIGEGQGEGRGDGKGGWENSCCYGWSRVGISFFWIFGIPMTITGAVIENGAGLLAGGVVMFIIGFVLLVLICCDVIEPKRVFVAPIRVAASAAASSSASASAANQTAMNVVLNMPAMPMMQPGAGYPAGPALGMNQQPGYPANPALGMNQQPGYPPTAQPPVNPPGTVLPDGIQSNGNPQKPPPYEVYTQP